MSKVKRLQIYSDLPRGRQRIARIGWCQWSSALALNEPAGIELSVS